MSIIFNVLKKLEKNAPDIEPSSTEMPPPTAPIKSNQSALDKIIAPIKKIISDLIIKVPFLQKLSIPDSIKSKIPSLSFSLPSLLKKTGSRGPRLKKGNLVARLVKPLIAVLVVAVIGLGGYYVYKNYYAALKGQLTGLVEKGQSIAKSAAPKKVATTKKKKAISFDEEIAPESKKPEVTVKIPEKKAIPTEPTVKKPKILTYEEVKTRAEDMILSKNDSTLIRFVRQARKFPEKYQKLLLELIQFSSESTKFPATVLALSEELYTNYPTEVIPRKIYARELMKQNRAAEAVKILLFKLPNFKDNIDYYYLLASGYVRTGDIKRANLIYIKLVGMDSTNPKFWLGVGLTSQMLNDDYNALNGYKHALQFSEPTWPAIDFINRQINRIKTNG